MVFESEVRSGGGLWLAEDATGVKGIGPVLQAGRGMQRSVSNRPSYLHLWHEFLNIQPKRFPGKNPVSEILSFETRFY